MKVARLFRAAKEAAGWAWIAAGRPVAELVPVRVSVTVRRGRRMDQSNVWDGLKPVLDGLFKKALTPDDGDRYVVLGDVHQETGDRFLRQPEVEFHVEERAPP